MKDLSNDLRRLNRGRREARIRAIRRQELALTEGENGHYRAKEQHTNWRIRRYSMNEVVAIEPNRDYETPFDGTTAFWDAVEYAAAELRKGEGDDQGRHTA